MSFASEINFSNIFCSSALLKYKCTCIHFTHTCMHLGGGYAYFSFMLKTYTEKNGFKYDFPFITVPLPVLQENHCLRAVAGYVLEEIYHPANKETICLGIYFFTMQEHMYIYYYVERTRVRGEWLDITGSLSSLCVQIFTSSQRRYLRIT